MTTTSGTEDKRLRGNREHLWHVWMNERQQERLGAGEPFEHSLYAFKELLGELRRLPTWMTRARTGTLPTLHQQCSQSPVEPIPDNRLICALGVDVTACPILASLYQSVRRHREGTATRADSWYHDVTDEQADILAAQTCCWHVFTTVLSDPRGAAAAHDGYVQDESDRTYWRGVWENLRADDGVWDGDELWDGSTDADGNYLRFLGYRGGS